MGDKTTGCGKSPDPIVQGEPTVLIGDMPAARLGDMTAKGGVIAAGCATVLIGISQGGRCLKDAAAKGAAYVRGAG